MGPRLGQGGQPNPEIPTASEFPTGCSHPFVDPVTTATLLASASLQFDPLLVLLTESAGTRAGSLFQPWIRGLNIGFLFALLFGKLGSERVISRKEKQT